MTDREVIRCGKCKLVQFKPISQICRRCWLPFPKQGDPERDLKEHLDELDTAWVAVDAEYAGRTMVIKAGVAQIAPRLRPIAEIERQSITVALAFYSPKEAAAMLGLGEGTIYKRMALYGITTPDHVKYKTQRLFKNQRTRK